MTLTDLRLVHLAAKHNQHPNKVRFYSRQGRWWRRVERNRCGCGRYAPITWSRCGKPDGNSPFLFSRDLEIMIHDSSLRWQPSHARLSSRTSCNDSTTRCGSMKALYPVLQRLLKAGPSRHRGLFPIDE